MVGCERQETAAAAAYNKRAYARTHARTAEASKHDAVHGANACAGQHGNGQLWQAAGRRAVRGKGMRQSV